MKDYYLGDKIKAIALLLMANTIYFIVGLLILIRSIYIIIFRSSDKYVK
jgi:hypothetical protein